MADLILDTSVLVGRERGVAAMEGLIAPGDDVAIAAVTVAELLVGVQRATGAQREARRVQVEAILAVVPRLDYGLDIARSHAALLAHVGAAGRPRGAHDLIIAATAHAHGRTVVTLDRRGFSDLPGVAVRTGG